MKDSGQLALGSLNRAKRAAEGSRSPERRPVPVSRSA